MSRFPAQITVGRHPEGQLNARRNRKWFIVVHSWFALDGLPGTAASFRAEKTLTFGSLVFGGVLRLSSKVAANDLSFANRRLVYPFIKCFTFS